MCFVKNEEQNKQTKKKTTDPISQQIKIMSTLHNPGVFRSQSGFVTNILTFYLCYLLYGLGLWVEKSLSF